MPVAADLVDAPVDFQAVAVGIAELNGDLAAGAAPAFEVDLRRRDRCRWLRARSTSSSVATSKAR